MNVHVCRLGGEQQTDNREKQERPNPNTHRKKKTMRSELDRPYMHSSSFPRKACRPSPYTLYPILLLAKRLGLVLPPRARDRPLAMVGPLPPARVPVQALERRQNPILLWRRQLLLGLWRRADPRQELPQHLQHVQVGPQVLPHPAGGGRWPRGSSSSSSTGGRLAAHAGRCC